MAYQQQQWGAGGGPGPGGYNQSYTQYPPQQQYGPPPRTNTGPTPPTSTFYPGADEYMMPAQASIVSPSPQRVMPEVPDNIAGSLENLEITPRNPQRAPSHNMNPGAPYGNMNGGGYNQRTSPPGSAHGPGRLPPDGPMPSMTPAEELMCFPRLFNPGPNIPPTDEEKAAQIEEARLDVLSSNDPEMQLVWAQDALSYVDTTMQHLARVNVNARPQTPPLERQLKTDAMSVVNFLADQHHPRAEFMRGNWLEFGKFGVPADKKEAFRCYARAAEKGFSRAEYRMGMQFENSNEPMKAIKHYNKGAADGDSASTYRLGMMTLLGQHGQAQDFARGVELLRMSAEYADENAPQGAYVYGLLLSRDLPGVDVPDHFLQLDIDIAREMIEKAAFLGFARAQLKMGSAYELCLLNCDFDPALSMHYNALASRQGEAEAQMAISKWFLCGHEGVFEKNEELAYVYAKRAAQQGLATAEFALGYFHEIGMYVPANIRDAQYWYGKAASHGNKDAQGRLDGISRANTLSRKDHGQAVAAIKSRHGSMRGKNPRTARQQYKPTMDAPTEEGPVQVSMPEPNNSYGPPGGQSAPLNANNNFIRTDFDQPGPRSGTPQGGRGPAPYPQGGPLMDPRPSSAAGYGAQRQPHPRHHPGGPPGRGRLLADNRPLSIAGGPPGAIPPAGTYPPQASVPPRAGSAAPGAGGFRPPPAGGPGGSNGRFGPGPQQGPNGRPGPGPGPLSPPPQNYGGPHRPPPIGTGPVADIGFEAPPPSPRPGLPGNPRPPRSPAPGGRPGTAGPRPGTANSGQSGPGMYHSPQQSPMGPNFPGQQGPSAASPRGGTPQPPQQQPMAPPVQQQAPPPQVTQPEKPKPNTGKGPKTFEEMGVPNVKQEQDCTIM